MELFDRHRATLDKALAAIRTREYWSPYPESPRAYDDAAPEEGQAAFLARLGKPFALDQTAESWTGGDEASPYGIELGVTYQAASAPALLDAAEAAANGWARRIPRDQRGRSDHDADTAHRTAVDDPRRAPGTRPRPSAD